MKRLVFSMAVVAVLVAGYGIYRRLSGPDPRSAMLMAWLTAPGAHPNWAVRPLERCQASVFVQPTYGYIDYRWGDSFRPGHRHQGLDIFGGETSGKTPVYAAFDGYVTRLAGWKSSLIMRIPQDPLDPRRQIWLYYTHMASAAGKSTIEPQFPPDVSEVFVRAGALLGYQGNYSGTPGSPTGVHLHFSIVRDDGSGQFLNELEIENTLDPSPYFNLPLDGRQNPAGLAVCPQAAGITLLSEA